MTSNPCAALRIIILTVPLARLPADDAERWRRWLTVHGLDPADVLCGRPIVCDDAARSVTWSGLDPDTLTPVRKTVRGERAALPFPTARDSEA